MAGLEGSGNFIDLPHCWNTTDTYQMGRHSFVGHGAYRKAFTLPELSSPGTWHLRSEGFYGLVDIWLDGRRIVRTDAQYLGLNIALDPLSPGDHTLALQLDNRKHRNVLPGFSAPDFLLYGGLTGRVWLERRPTVAIDVEALTVQPLIAEAGRDSVVIRHPTSVCETLIEVFDETGTAVARSEAPPSARVDHHLRWDQPRRWSPDDPSLYRAEVTLSNGSEVLDTATVPFGLVSTEFRFGEGLFINGDHIELHGSNRHESIPGLGSALPAEIQRRDAEVLKELGCNFVRLSHYPQHPAFLDACDELGLLVYPEIATWKSVRSNRGWLKAARRQMRDLILRDRHRPSIILWGMGNESRSKKAYFELGKIIRHLDPQRSTTYAENHLYRARRKKIIGMPDVWCTNYELDVLKEAAASSRTGNVVVSECCNHPHSVKGDEREELTQLNTLHRDWEAMADLPFVAGYAVWCLTDYATEHRDRFRRQPGLLDAWRRPKMAAELFRARHSRQPFVAMFVTGQDPDRIPSRFRREMAIGTTGDHEIHVFSNCEQVTVSIDGAEACTLDGAIHWIVAVDSVPRIIEAQASRHSVDVRSTWQSSGPACRVELHPRAVASPGGTIEIDLQVVDSEGVTARDFNGRCRLVLDGPARLNAFTEANEAEIARGEGRTYITCETVDRGEIHITATAEGLESGTALIGWGGTST